MGLNIVDNNVFYSTFTNVFFLIFSVTLFYVFQRYFIIFERFVYIYGCISLRFIAV